MKIAISLLFVIIGVLAEPPVPQYLPPSNQYGPPGNGGNGNGGHRPGPQYGAPNPQYGAPNGNGGDGEDAPASYQFEYMVKDEESGNDFGHEESREGDVAKGKYYVLLPDGRKQIVEYTADSEGYKPMVTYEGEANGGAGGYPKGPSGNGNGGYPRGPSGNGNGGGGYPSGPSGNGGYNY